MERESIAQQEFGKALRQQETTHGYKYILFCRTVTDQCFTFWITKKGKKKIRTGSWISAWISLPFCNKTTGIVSYLLAPGWLQFYPSHQSLQIMSFLAMTLWTPRRNFHSSRINSLPGRNAFEVFSREVLTQVCSLSIYVKNGTAPDPTVGTVLQCIQITVWVQPSISKYFLFLYLETKINHWTNFSHNWMTPQAK